MMFDGGGTVEGAELNGCWGTCHTDLRTMKDAKDDKKTKYIKGADLASGKFMDLIQYRSGKGEKPVDGHVADKRVMEGGKALVKAEGAKEGNKWVVTFERSLAGGAQGDHAITPGKVYNFGFAIHEDYLRSPLPLRLARLPVRPRQDRGRRQELFQRDQAVRPEEAIPAIRIINRRRQQ